MIPHSIQSCIEYSVFEKEIEKNRTSDFSYSHPQLQPGIPVRIRQTAHQFLFGADLQYFNKLETKEANRFYKDLFGSLFNSALIADRSEVAQLLFCERKGITPCILDLADEEKLYFVFTGIQEIDPEKIQNRIRNSGKQKINILFSFAEEIVPEEQLQMIRNLYPLFFSMKEVNGIFWKDHAVFAPILLGALQTLIREKWQAVFETSSDPDGQVKIRGFRGTYMASWIDCAGCERLESFRID